MVQREVADLALNSRAVDRNRPGCGCEGSDDRRDRAIVEVNSRHLGEDRLLPRLVAVPSLLTPRRARGRVELAVTAVGEGAVAFEAAATHAGQQTTEEVDPRALAGSAALRLGPPDVLYPRPPTARLTPAGSRHGAGLQVSWRLRRWRGEPLLDNPDLVLNTPPGRVNPTRHRPVRSLKGSHQS